MEIERPKSKQPIPQNAKRVFKGILFDVYQWEQEMFDGSRTIFEKLKRLDTVVIFPVLPDGKILLLEQKQPGKEVFIGAPAGRVDKGEDILTAAKRELLEETGYIGEEFILWDARQPSSKIDYAVFTFIAKGLKKISGLKPDGGEKIVLKPVKFDEFVEISTREKVGEKETIMRFIEAKYDPKKKEELRKLFSPNY